MPTSHTPDSRAQRPRKLLNQSARKGSRNDVRRQRQGWLRGAAAAVILVALIAIIAVSVSRRGGTTDAGGFVAGKPIDGVQCGATEGQTQHIHQHFNVVVNGQETALPALIGIFSDSGKTPNAPCLYWLHTHSPDGVIHVEAPVKDQLTLGAFLDIWSVSPVDRTLLDRITANRPDRIILDGTEYTGDLRAIPLKSHTLITVEYGNPAVPQQPFDFQRAGLPT